MDMDLEEDVEHSHNEGLEQIKVLEQKISRLEKLVKSRDEALSEMYDLEKNKNEEIFSLKDRIKQDGVETLRLQDLVKTLNDEIMILNKKIDELEQQNINNLKQKQIMEASSPRIVEDLLTNKESLYKEIANLRLQISQLESKLADKDDELTSLKKKLADLEFNNELEIKKLKDEKKNVEKTIFEKEFSQKKDYENKIDLLEENNKLLRQEFIEMLNMIAFIFSKSLSSEENNTSLISESKMIILNSIPFSNIAKEIIQIEMDDFNIREESLSFSKKFLENFTKLFSDKKTPNQGNLMQLIRSFDIHLFNFFIKQIPLLSTSHTETLYEEKKFILNCISLEYESIKKFLNILLLDSEKQFDDNSLNIFEIFVDLLYEDINFQTNSEDIYKTTMNICLSDKQSELYLNTRNIFRLIINSIIQDNSEDLIKYLNKIISFKKVEDSRLKKIEFNEQMVEEEENLVVKKIIFSLFKLNFGYGWNILHLLSYIKHIDSFQLLLEQFTFEEKINIINKTSYSGFSPITFSVLTDNALLMELLLSFGAEINVQDNRRNTLLHLTNNHEIQEILLKRRIATSLRNSSGQLPNLIHSKSQISKLHLDNFKEIESEIELNESFSNSIVNVNTVNINEAFPATPKKNYRSLSSHAIETNYSEDKVVLSAWVSGNEPTSTCRDDFCVFSTPEFEYSSDNAKESSLWNMFGFKSNNKNVSNIYKGKNGDHAAMEQNYDRLEEMKLTSVERKKGIWSDIVINYTARGLEKSCFPPPLDSPTNIFRQILVLTSERFALFQYSPLKLLQAAPIIDFEEIIVPKNSNVLLLIKVDGWDDILLEVNRRSEFLEEFTIAYRTITTPSEILLSHVVTESSNVEKKIEKSNSFWLKFLSSNEDNNNYSGDISKDRIDKLSPARATAFQNLISVYGESPPIVTEPDNLIGLFNSENQYSLVLAIINKSSFILLPHRETSLLVSVPTYHFGFLGICINPPLALENPLSPKKKSLESIDNNNEPPENRLWQERFFILRSDGILLWCHHPNDKTYCENIPIRLVRQIRVFNLATNIENEIIPCFALDFTKNSVPSSLILHSDSSEMRDKWVEKIHNVRTVISDSNN